MPTDTTKSWLVKPRRSAGGAGIRPWRGERFGPHENCQEYVEGVPCSALYVGRHDASATFLGATRQLIGKSWLHAGGFQYCGNIGPLKLTTVAHKCLLQLGDLLSKDFALRGLLARTLPQGDTPWPVEVNPRYTAGMEVLERSAGQSFFLQHCSEFTAASLPMLAAADFSRVHGKAILFAECVFTCSKARPLGSCPAKRLVFFEPPGLRRHSPCRESHREGTTDHDLVRPCSRRLPLASIPCEKKRRPSTAGCRIDKTVCRQTDQ